MSRQYQRRLVIRFGTREVSDFDCAFNIVRTLDYAQNTAQVQIYNLATETRRELQAMRNGLVVEVLAGYQDDERPAVLCRQNLRVISSQRQGPDWITTIESGDGDIVKATAVQGTWPAGTSLKQVALDLAKQLVPNVKQLIGTLAGVPDQPIDDPMTVQSQGDKQLGEVLDQLGVEASWQNNELVARRTNEEAGGVAVLLSPETGLIDSPEVQGIRGFIRVPILQVRCLLNPAIVPGSLISVESAGWSGQATARRVSHTGQSWGGEWTTDVEAMIHGS